MAERENPVAASGNPDEGSGENISVRIVLTPEDAFTSVEAIGRSMQSAAGRRRLIRSMMMRLIAVLLGGGTGYMLTTAMDWELSLFACTVGSLVAVLLVVATQWAYYADASAKGIIERVFLTDPAGFSPRQMTLGGQDLLEERQGMSSKLALVAIRCTTETDRLILIWVSKSSAWTIPKSSFANEGAATSFKSILDGRIARAKATIGISETR